MSINWLLTTPCDTLIKLGENHLLLRVIWRFYKSASEYESVFRICAWIIIHRIFFLNETLGAKDKIDHLNSWLAFSFKFLAYSEFLSVPFSFSIVIERYAQFLLYNLPRTNIFIYMLHNCNDLLCLYYWKRLNFLGVSFNVKFYSIICKYLQAMYEWFCKLLISRSKR